MDNQRQGLHCRDVCEDCLWVDRPIGRSERNTEAHLDQQRCMGEGEIAGCTINREAQRRCDDQDARIYQRKRGASWSER